MDRRRSSGCGLKDGRVCFAVNRFFGQGRTCLRKGRYNVKCDTKVPSPSPSLEHGSTPRIISVEAPFLA
jgi:hypothetical protein